MGSFCVEVSSALFTVGSQVCADITEVFYCAGAKRSNLFLLGAL